MITLNAVLAILQSLMHIIEMIVEAKPPEQRAVEVARFDKAINALVDMMDKLKDKAE